MFQETSFPDDEPPQGPAAVEPSVEVVCPYCAQPSEILVDPASGTDQSYVEDCEVCCRPWGIRVRFHDGVPSVEIGTEDDPGF